jgi:hypothetical protein
MSCIEIAVIACATIIGPVVAVLISLRVQSRMDARHRNFEKQMEEERHQFEVTRANGYEKFVDAWKVADRDRMNNVQGEMKRIADALEALLKQSPQLGR